MGNYNSYPSYVRRPPLRGESSQNDPFTLSRVELFDKPSHVFAEILHCLYAFRIVSNLSRITSNPHIPVCGSGNDHLVIQEQVV